MSKSQEIRVQDLKIQQVVKLKKEIEEQKKIMSIFFLCEISLKFL